MRTAEIVGDLRAVLNHENDFEQAAATIRTLIDKIQLHPINGELKTELVGDIATLVGLSEANITNKKRPVSLSARALRNGCLRGHAIIKTLHFHNSFECRL